MSNLTPQELERYNRQILIEGWGKEGQLKLKNSTVFVAGAGGLGSPAAIYLASAGVGKIIIVDYDKVELSNLNRQILHNLDSVGVMKSHSAEKALKSMNPWVKLEAVVEKIDENSVDRLVNDADIIVDCMDNFPTRFILNDCAIRKNIPFVHGCIWGLEGRLTFIQSPETACLRCIFPEAPEREVFPVLGATPGVIGVLQAMEVLKYLTGVGKTLKNRMLLWNGLDMSFDFIKLRKDPQCVSCTNS